jgi:predicted anti-sigma-YlaC factor YlaD
MAMSEHDMVRHGKIRKLLALAAAGALTSAEEKQVAEHLRSCTACSNELEAWRPIASELRRLPTPQPSSWLVQATLARAEAKLAEQAEHDWNRRIMVFVVAFAWLLTIASWPAFHFVSRRFGSMVGPQFTSTWMSFAAFTALGWLAGGVAAVMLAIRQRGERRLA